MVKPLSYRSALTKFGSPKKTIALISLALTTLSAIRVVVCVTEAYSAVAQERQSDNELMVLCKSGDAASSADFRALCLKKRSERAAPILLKALLRAVTTAFQEFCETFGTTSRLFFLVLFCITGVAAPLVKAVAQIFVQNLKQRRQRRQEFNSDSDSDDDNATGFQVVDVGVDHRYNTRQKLRNSLRRSLRSAAERLGVEPLELGFSLKEA